MRNIRLMIAIAMAFGFASMAANTAQAGHPGMRGKTSVRINTGRRNTVQGNGPRHTVAGPVVRNVNGFAHYGSFAGRGGFGGGFGGGYGLGGPFGGGFGFPYATGRIPTPPYFSIHPPVYYSRPVPRTYGYSPFAYSGNVRTPEIVAPDLTQSITNPYVEQTKTVDTKEDGEPTPASEGDFAKAEPQPQTIVNPYVDHPSQFPPAFDMEVTVSGN